MDIRQTNCPSRRKEGDLGVLRGQTFKSLEKLSNGWTDWHQVWLKCADSSENEHRLNTSRPTIPQGAFRVFFRGSQIQMSGKVSNCSTDWHQISYTSVDSSGNGHRLKQFAPRYPTVAFWGVLGSQQHPSLRIIQVRKITRGDHFVNELSLCGRWAQTFHNNTPLQHK